MFEMKDNHMKDNKIDHANLSKIRKEACDDIITGAARLIVHDVGVTAAEMVDRMLTFSAAQLCKSDGRNAASATFRQIADQIDSGIFAAVEPKGAVQ